MLEKEILARAFIAQTELIANGYAQQTENGIKFTEKGWDRAREIWNGLSDTEKILVGYIARNQLAGKFPLI